MNELALFAGAGGGILGGRMLGWRTRCAVEINPFCRSVLLQRQRDGHLDRFPVWDDIRTFDGRPWRSSIGIVTGGFPCQGISTAGSRKGLADSRSALWFEMLRVVGEARPKFVFAENSPNLRANGLGTVVEGLNSLGYDVRWCVLGAWHLGAPHRRNRLWILASDPNGIPIRNNEQWDTPKDGRAICNKRQNEFEQHGCEGALAGPFGDPNRNRQSIDPRHAEVAGVSSMGVALSRGQHSWWSTKPVLGRVAHGLANRVDRLKSIGNGQVPVVAAAAFKILSDEFTGAES